MTTHRQQRWADAAESALERHDDGAAALYAAMALPTDEEYERHGMVPYREVEASDQAHD
jgi:hypothetical protein